MSEEEKMTRILIVSSLLAVFFAQTAHAQTVLPSTARVQFSVRLTQPAASPSGNVGMQISLTRALEIQQVSGMCEQNPYITPATVRSINLSAFNPITPLTPLGVVWSAPELTEKPTLSSFASVNVPVQNGVILPTLVKLQAMPNGTSNALSIGMTRSATGTVASCFITIIGEWK
jgi:hypothetical protein